MEELLMYLSPQLQFNTVQLIQVNISENKAWAYFIVASSTYFFLFYHY